MKDLKVAQYLLDSLLVFYPMALLVNMIVYNAKWTDIDTWFVAIIVMFWIPLRWLVAWDLNSESDNEGAACANDDNEMATKLSIWTLNAKKWKQDNGFITPEWKQYTNNIHMRFLFVLLIGITLGVYLSIFVLMAN
ncbi:MAG: hypothetical protein KAJ03_04680 [Gammaproteobacteria bacterium]|nr:hypothetical protein [Gammaproteobacteria bacterium]